VFKEWEDKVKELSILDNLKEHAGVKIILNKFNHDIEEMNFLLKTAKSKELPGFERDLVIEKRNMYEWFTELFLNLNKEAKDIEKAIKKEDEHFEEHKEEYIN